MALHIISCLLCIGSLSRINFDVSWASPLSPLVATLDYVIKKIQSTGNQQIISSIYSFCIWTCTKLFNLLHGEEMTLWKSCTRKVAVLTQSSGSHSSFTLESPEEIKNKNRSKWINIQLSKTRSIKSKLLVTKPGQQWFFCSICR